MRCPTDTERSCCSAHSPACGGGELAGLRRWNVDLDGCTVRVESIVVELGSGRILEDQDPKSDAGRRTVTFPAQLKPLMEAHMVAFVEAGPMAYAFTSPMGKVLRRANFRETWVTALKAAGLAEVRFHDLRHTGATTGATLKELMRRIGHSTEKAALNYEHAAAGRDQEIASALDKLIKKERGKTRGHGGRGDNRKKQGDQAQ